jgi:uncharacterized protein (TIGR00251 family)
MPRTQGRSITLMPNKTVRVKVRAGARKESCVEKQEGVFEISVKEPAEKNRANARVVELIARHFRVAAREVRIVKGQRSPGKMLRVSR